MINDPKIIGAGSYGVLVLYKTRSNQNIGIKAPMIHLIADMPEKRHDYLDAIFEMYDINGEGSKLTQILNLKNSKQDTFLDYLYLRMTHYKTAMGEESKKYYEKVFITSCR